MKRKRQPSLSAQDQSTLKLLAGIPELAKRKCDERGRRGAVNAGTLSSAAFSDSLTSMMESSLHAATPRNSITSVTSSTDVADSTHDAESLTPPASSAVGVQHAPGPSMEAPAASASSFCSRLRELAGPFLSTVVSRCQELHGIDVTTAGSGGTPLQADHVCWRCESIQEYIELKADLLCRASGGCNELLVESIIGGRPISTFRLNPPLEITVRRNHTNKAGDADYADNTDNSEGSCGSGGSSGDGWITFQIECLELPCPKPRRFYASGLEHVEFVVGDTRPGAVNCAAGDASGGTQYDASSSTSSNAGSDGEGPVGTTALRRFRARYPCVVFDERAFDKTCNPDLTLALGNASDRPINCKFHQCALSKVVAYEKAHGMVESVPEQYFCR